MIINIISVIISLESKRGIGGGRGDAITPPLIGFGLFGILWSPPP